MISQQTQKNSIIILSGNIFKVLGGFFSTTLLAQKLGPEVFGRFSIFLSIFLIVTAISDFGINISFVRLFTQKKSQDELEADMFLKNVFLIRLLISACFFIFTIFFFRFLSPLFTNETVPVSIIIMGSFLIISESLLSFFLSIEQAFQKFNYYTLVGSIPIILRLILLLIFYNANTLNIFTAFGSFVISSLLVVTYLFFSKKYYVISLQMKLLTHSMKEIFSWSKWLFIHTIANVFFVKLDILFLGYFRVKEFFIGQYALANTFASAITIVQNSFLTFLLPKVSDFKSVGQVTSYKKKSLKFILYLFPFIIVFIVSGKYFIEMFYGAGYSDSSTIFLILSSATALSLLATPISVLAFSLNKPHLLVIDNVAGMILISASAIFLVPFSGIYGAAYATLISRFGAELLIIVYTLITIRNLKTDLAL